MTTSIHINCPHCNGEIEIEVIACGIFRHGQFKINGQQINPHESKEKCDYYTQNNLIWGCGKPFRYNTITNTVEICDYI